jgi:hypothetical protein
VLLALATALPWISVPGGQLGRQLLLLHEDSMPATGPIWQALPLLSAFVGLLMLLAVVTAVLEASRSPRRRTAAIATCALGLLVLAVLAYRLLVDRTGGDYSAVGAGGYLGLVAVGTIVVAAAAILYGRPIRRRPRPARPERLPSAPLSLRWAIAAGGALLVAYVATRAPFASRFPYFVDEALYADYASLAAAASDELFISLEIGQGPVLIWLGALGVKLGLEPVPAIRMVSLASGLLTAGVIGLLGRYLWGSLVGWLAAGLSVVLPLFLVHDGIGLYEPLVTLIMVSALFLQIAMARRPSLWIAVALGLVLGVGVLTKQNTAPALLLLPASLLCFDWSSQQRRQRIVRWVAGVAVVGLLVLAADAVQRSSKYYEKREAATENLLIWPARSTTEVLEDPFGVLGDNLETYGPALVGYVTIPLLLATLLGALLAWRIRPRLPALLLAWSIIPLAIGLTFQLRPYPRHTMFLLPPAILLSAYALARAGQLAQERLPRRAVPVACAAGVALVLAPAVVLDARVLADPAGARYPGLDYWQYVAGWPAGGPWRDAADRIEHDADAGPVVILTPGTYPLLRHNLADDERYSYAPPGTGPAARAQFGVMDTSGFPVDPKGFANELARRGYKPIASYRRPRGPCSGPREPACGGAGVVYGIREGEARGARERRE